MRRRIVLACACKWWHRLSMPWFSAWHGTCRNSFSKAFVAPRSTQQTAFALCTGRLSKPSIRFTPCCNSQMQLLCRPAHCSPHSLQRIPRLRLSSAHCPHARGSCPTVLDQIRPMLACAAPLFLMPYADLMPLASPTQSRGHARPQPVVSSSADGSALTYRVAHRLRARISYAHECRECPRARGSAHVSLLLGSQLNKAAMAPIPARRCSQNPPPSGSSNSQHSSVFLGNSRSVAGPHCRCTDNTTI